MKPVTSIAACAAALAFAACPAGAQNFDTAFITQVEAVGNTAVIEQVASQGGNYATIDQIPGPYYGSGNTARVLQLGVGDSQVRLNQSGQMNDYTVRQVDGRNLTAFVDTGSYWDGALGGEFNTVLIEQSGFNSSARVDNGFGSHHNRAEVMQQGFQNQANIAQYSTGGSLASVYQAGSNLTGVITQSGGYGNSATIRQQGQSY
jgi:hypothetical protein